MREYLSRMTKSQSYDEILVLFSSARSEVFDFFEHVKVNDDSDDIRKNRLELLNFFCKTYEIFIDFQLIKDINE